MCKMTHSAYNRNFSSTSSQDWLPHPCSPCSPFPSRVHTLPQAPFPLQEKPAAPSMLTALQHAATQTAFSSFLHTASLYLLKETTFKFTLLSPIRPMVFFTSFRHLYSGKHLTSCMTKIPFPPCFIYNPVHSPQALPSSSQL